MIRLQDRDLEILNDVGVCQLMSYSQLQKLHFESYLSCTKRVGLLQRYKYLSGTFYNTNEKVFLLTKEGNKVLGDLMDKDYKLGDYGNIYHKLMRTELYCSLKKYKLDNWINEALVKDINRIFDVSFEYNDNLYLVEVHNEQKSKVLKEKLVECLNLDIKFNLIIYCKNKNIVNTLLQKMDTKGFNTHRKFGIKVYQTGEEIQL